MLDGLDPQVREFLRESSVLGDLTGHTCDLFLARSDSRQLLDDLERRGLLVGGSRGGDTDGRYRLPPLLHEALSAELAARSGPAALRVRHARAGEVLEAAGDWWGAVRAFAAAQDAEALERLARSRPADVGPLARPGAPDAGGLEPLLRDPALAGGPPTGAVGAPRLTVRLLGTFEIIAADTPVDLAGLRPRVRSVLQYLALHADAYVHRDVLAAVLWPESDQETGRRGVQVAVSALRSLLQPGLPRQSTLLPRRGDAYALALAGHGSSDVVELHAQLTRARRTRAVGDVDSAIAAWREVGRLYRGELLLEQGNAEWVVAERDRLRLATADALESLGRHLVAGDDAEEGIEALRRALELEPFRDGTWRILAERHEALGDLSAAAAVRQRHRRVLVDLGVLDDVVDVRTARERRNGARFS